MAEFCPFCKHYRIGMAQLNSHCQKCHRRIHCSQCQARLKPDGNCPNEHAGPILFGLEDLDKDLPS